MRELIIFVTNALINWAEKRGRVLKITGTAGPDDVYLVRWYIVKSKYFNFWVHKFLRSDRDDLHDHPWNFATYLVSGAYTENKWNEKIKQVEQTRRAAYLHPDDGHFIKLNRFVFRKATDQHQVVVDRDLTMKELDQAATTLFFSGPTKREWGFVRQYSGSLGVRLWVPWREYLGLPKDTPGRG